LALPLPLEFRRVEVGRLAWRDGAAEPRLDLRALSFSANWYRQLVLRDVALEREGAPWGGELALGLEPPHRLEATVAGSVWIPAPDESDQADGGRPLALRVSASGDLEQSRWRAEVEEPAVLLSGELRNLLGEPEWDLQLSAPLLAWPLAGAEPAVTFGDLEVSSYGRLSDYGLEARARISADEAPVLDGRVVGSGDRSGLELEVLRVAGEALEAAGAGRLEWAPSPGLRIDAEVSHFDPQPWLASWNGAEPFTGKVQLAWAGDSLEFEVAGAGAPGTIGSLEASGALQADSGALTGLAHRR
jgi:hypothetical protein